MTLRRSSRARAVGEASSLQVWRVPEVKKGPRRSRMASRAGEVNWAAWKERWS